MDQLDEEVEACCNQCDDAADAAELEQQLSQFEQVSRWAGTKGMVGEVIPRCTVPATEAGCVPRKDARTPRSPGTVLQACRVQHGC